jgi:hypothetical protein
MAEPIVNIIDPTTFSQQTILPQDEVLIQNQVIDSPFDLTKDQVELYYYDYSQNLISANYNFLDWKSYNDPSLIAKNKLQDLYVDPAIDGVVAEVPNGIVYLIYNFVSNKLNSSDQQRFYIDTISADRTEITLKTNNLSNEELETLTNTFVAELQLTPYFQEFYLNFGDNNSIIGLNIRVNKNNPVYSLDVKLYEPLPSSAVLKDTCWVQTQIADPIGYSVEYNTRIILVDQQIPLRGPNFNLKAVGETSVATNLENLTTLKQTNLTGSRAQIDSILNEKGVVLNIDYTDFNNFVHFSSAETRLENFYTKVSLIEDYQNSINQITASNTTETRDTSITILQNEINSLVENFDGYEYFLYYSSESKAWPKTNSTAPYILATTGSSLVLNWYGNSVEGAPYFGGERYSASIYDNQNQDNLVYTIPQFIVNDSTNLPYITFVEMVGQHFDTLYTYTQAISQKYNADNRLNYGVSKDLVADVLRSFGIKIYENNFSPADLYSALLGITPAGATLLLPDITTTYPVTGSGLEYIQTIISASSDVIGLDDLNKSIYKRLYHNLPLLVKKKGTLAGLRLLVNSYGIPDTILRINEFGGKDRASNTWDKWQQQYDYSYDTKGVGFISSSFTLNSNWNATGNKPSAVEFRFKTPGLPSSNYYSQSLWSTDNGATLILKYTGSGLTSGSYSGSTVNPYYEYGLLEFYPSSSNLTATASIYLPFFNGDWWSILINKSSSTDFTVYAKNKLYNGDTGCILGYQASSSINLTNPWVNATNSYFGTSTFNAKTFSGSLQEIRYYTQPISENTFDAYVMNPQSIEQSEYLAFRGALGGELYTASISIHPKISGEQVTTSSFVGNSTYFITSSGEFTSNVETTFYDQVASGVKNAISNKIRVGENTGYGTVLSSQISIQQHTSSTSFTPNVNYLEVGFSPQNEINEDINSQLGYFNIGEYIGDPRFISESNYRYPDLNAISTEYFKKYTQSYDLEDYFRLIKFFDNSLFKLIKDFIPARTGAATGAIVKQHLLERNRQRPAQVSYTQPEYTASVTSVARDYQTGSIGVFTGGPGGSVNALTNTSQSWSSSILTPEGLVNQINSSQYEFFNGEYSGSSIPAKPIYELNLEPLLNNATGSRISTYYQDVDYNQNALNPTNFSTIITDSATRAAVQDSNYSSGSVWVNARYGGSRLSSKLYNRYTAGDVSYGKTAAIDNYSNYIAQFDWIGGSDPQYPGGGNIHIIGLIHIDGTVIGLDGNNSNLNLVEQIFRQGDLATAYISSYSSNQSVGTLEIETGGALYDTIMFKSGSVTGADGIAINYSSSTAAYDNAYFVTESLNILTDSGSSNAGWLYALITGSSAAFGPVVSYQAGIGPGLQIFNKTTGQYVQDSAFVPAADSYFPLQYGDFIRFGYDSGGVNGVDYSFNGTALFRLQKALTGSDYNVSSSLLVPSSVVTSFPSVQTDQNFRIFRRVPNETFVLVKKKPIYAGGGLLIPANFNPNYNPIDVARKAGVTL